MTPLSRPQKISTSYFPCSLSTSFSFLFYVDSFSSKAGPLCLLVNLSFLFSLSHPRDVSAGIGCSPLCHREYLCNQEASRRRCGGASGVWNLLAGLTLGWRIPVKYIHASERDGLFVSCYTKHSATLRRDSILLRPPPQPPPRYENRNPCLKFGWGKMKREASAATFRSFWCLGNAHSIIKAARHVKLFVQFPEQQPNWELVMESRSFETASIYARQVFCLRRRLDGNLHYFYITVPSCLVL